jgi:uncharacterized protein involved in exopolysaccharide biosynthesis
MLVKKCLERAMNDNLDLFALLKSIIRHRKFIIIFVVVVSIAAVAYALWYPKHWESTVKISVTSESAAFPGFLQNLISGYSSELEGLAGNSEADVQYEVLTSRDFSEKAVRTFDLIKYFKVKQSKWDKDSLNVIDYCIEKFTKKIISISVNEVTGTIVISAVTKDKKLSKDIVEFYVDELDTYNRKTRVTKGKEKREFLEKRVKEVETELNDLAEDLAAFQQKNNIINIDEQVTAAIEAFSEIIKQKVTTATELEFMIKTLPKGNPKLEEYQTRLKALNVQIDRMSNDSFSKYIPNFDNVNALMLVYLKKKMKIEIATQIYQTLLPQYELAKLEELNDLTSIQYIQRAVLDGIREKPKRAKICIIAFLLACITACSMSFIYDILMTQQDKFKELLKTK